MEKVKNSNDTMVNVESEFVGVLRDISIESRKLLEMFNSNDVSESLIRIYQDILKAASLGQNEVTLHFPFPVEKRDKYTIEHENDIIIQDQNGFVYRIQIDQDREFYESISKLKERGLFKIDFISKKGESSSASDGWRVRESDYLVVRINW